MANKETRIAFATDDALEAEIQALAEDAGMSKSSYCEMVLRDHIGSKESKRNLPISAQAYHLFKELQEFESDGTISPIERNTATDDIAELLASIRNRCHISLRKNRHVQSGRFKTRKAGSASAVAFAGHTA